MEEYSEYVSFGADRARARQYSADFGVRQSFKTSPSGDKTEKLLFSQGPVRIFRTRNFDVIGFGQEVRGRNVQSPAELKSKITKFCPANQKCNHNTLLMRSPSQLLSLVDHSRSVGDTWYTRFNCHPPSTFYNPPTKVTIIESYIQKLCNLQNIFEN